MSCANNIALTNATSSSISANKVLTLTQSVDTYGASYLNLSNGTGACGVEIRTTSTTPLMSALWFATAATIPTRIIRLESRASAVCGIGQHDSA